jgi:hypothetical protein
MLQFCPVLPTERLVIFLKAKRTKPLPGCPILFLTPIGQIRSNRAELFGMCVVEPAGVSNYQF